MAKPATVKETNDTAATTPAKFAFKKKRNVTLPLFKMKDEEEMYFRFTGEMFDAKPLKTVRKDPDTKEPLKKPPVLCDVVNLETGEEGRIIINEVLKGTLNDEYPSAGYVGKNFAITRHAIAGNKSYATFSIVEIEVE